MYRYFYNLEKEPFHVTPDPEFLFLTPSHKQALGSIIYGVKNKKGFVVITGEVGVGKTTIIRSYLERIHHESAKIIYIFNSNVSFENLLRTIYKELALDVKSGEVVEMLNRLYQFLMEEYKQNRIVLLIIDEAQNMPIGTLENLRMLSNLETSKNKLIQIIMVGQPEFEKILDLNKLRQLRQRMAIRSTILPFTEKESIDYIKYRLTIAGMKDTPIVAESALRKIAKEAKGIPRIINILCDNALITGFGYKKRLVGSKIVKEVISDFRGRRKTPLLKWAFAPAALLLLIAGLFWLSPYKELLLPTVGNLTSPYKVSVSSKIENLNPSQNSEMNPIKEEAEPSVIQPGTSQTDPDDPSKENLELSEAKTIPKPSKASFPTVRTVKKGDNLFKLTRKVYGHVDDQLVEWVKQNNPWIKNADHLQIGEEIIFPELKEKRFLKDNSKEGN
jgi:general secretion pathway protein A